MAGKDRWEEWEEGGSRRLSGLNDGVWGGWYSVGGGFNKRFYIIRMYCSSFT